MKPPAQRVVSGRYALTGRLGQRGGRTVWRAQDTVLRRDVAVEELRAEPLTRTALLREARAAARLPVPGAVTVFDAVLDGDELFVITELVKARSLAEAVERDGPLAPEQVAGLGLELLAVVEGVQRQRVVHDGIGPSAILLVEGHAKLRGVGLGLGADLATDLADLAATLHHAVTGQDPAPVPALADILTALLATDPTERRADERLLATLRQLQRDRAPVSRPVGAISAARLVPSGAPASRLGAHVATVDPALAGGGRPHATRVPSAPAAHAERGRSPGARPRRTLASWRWAIAVLALLTVGAALLAAVRLTQGRPPGRASGESERTSAQAPAQRGPAPPARTAWQVVDDHQAGFALRVPLGWRAERRPGRAVFRSAGGALTVAVSWAGGRADPLAVLRERAEQFAGTPGFRQARLERVRFRGRDAAAWEYATGGLHERALAVNGAGRAYVLAVEVPGARWAASERLVEQIEEGFMVS